MAEQDAARIVARQQWPEANPWLFKNLDTRQKRNRLGAQLRPARTGGYGFSKPGTKL